MATASTTAWVLHDLGLAAGFGGTLFGKMALNPAVKEVRSREERGKVLDRAWRGFNGAQMLALVTIAGTWLVGRSLVSGRSVGRDVRRLVLAKDALVGAAVLTGAATSIGGALLAREHEQDGATPVISGGQPSPETPPRTRALMRFVNIAGDVNLGLMAGIMGVTTVLAMKSGKSTKWSLISRVLP